MSTIKLVSKGRKYFKAVLSGKYECKVHIDQKSESLNLDKEYDLDLDDLSVRSKFGTDLIFKIKNTEEEKKEIGICSISMQKINLVANAKFKKLGGTWDPESKSWIFSRLVESEVEELDDLYNSEEIAIEAICHTKKWDSEDYKKGVLLFFGYPIARAFSRDSGATVESSISIIEGGIYSGGSTKNWGCYMAEGTVFRTTIPLKLFEEKKELYLKWFDFKIL
jgi:hypothetical protein